MSKRPLDSDEDSVCAKKPRQNTELESMKMQLDALLKSAAEHHEETRITAVDRAFDLEEETKSAKKEWADKETELANLTADYTNATQYLETFESSQTVKMLTKVEDYEDDGVIKVDTLKKDSQQVFETLVKLKTLKQNLKEQQQALEEQVDAASIFFNKIANKYVDAEKEVQKITNLIEA